jgi:hypothetical protein
MLRAGWRAEGQAKKALRRFEPNHQDVPDIMLQKPAEPLGSFRKLGARYVPPQTSNAQAMRAILLASVTATTSTGRGGARRGFSRRSASTRATTDRPPIQPAH